MKKFILLSILLVFLFLNPKVFAQSYRTDSNTVTTTVGTGSGGIAACPIPNGVITCGSKNVPINGCGHCGIGYEQYYQKNCTIPGYTSIFFAMDIGGADFQNVLLPSVEGKTISWSFVSQANEIQPPTQDAPQAIQQYAGTDLSTGNKYWIQFHHTAPGSGKPGTHSSGDIGANICGNGCGMGHVHVEFAKVNTSGQNIWVDAPSYFCKK